MGTKLAIVGGGMTMLDAPFDDDTFDIWTTGSVSKAIPRASEIFDIHRTAMQSPEILNRHNCIVWMQERHEEVPHSEVFRVIDLEDRYGMIFDSSIAMMLAFAIMRGYKRIELYGVDMALKDEYERTRANLLYLIGYARGMGVSVVISEGSILMPPCRTYEYDDPSASEVKIMNYELELVEKLRAKDIEAMKVRDESQYLRGALDMMRELRKVYGG
jgi:hypothetical protein